MILVFRKFIFAVALLVMGYNVANAQKNHIPGNENAFIAGFVSDSTHHGLENVNIGVKGLKVNTQTDETGKYLLKVPANKERTLIFSYLKTKHTISVPAINPGDTFKVQNITMSAGNLDTVEIKAVVDKSHMMQMNLRQFDAIPNASGGVEGLLRVLPSVSSKDELSSQYSVRGGNYDENLVYINDIEIYRPLLAPAGQEEGLSIINPEMVQDLKFSAGGFEAKYGDKLSSVLDITYREPDTFSAVANASFLGGAANVEGGSADHRFTYLIGARYKNTSLLLGTLNIQGQYQPSFADIQSYITYDLTDKLKLGFLTYYGANRYYEAPVSQTTTFGTASDVIQLDVAFEGQEIYTYNTFLNGLTAEYTLNKYNRFKFIASEYTAQETQDYDVIAVYDLSQLDINSGSSTKTQSKTVFGAGGYLNHARDELDQMVMNAEFKGYHTSPKTKLLDFEWGIKAQHENITDNISEYTYMDSADFSQPQTNNNQLNMFNTIFSNYNLSWNRYMGYAQNIFPVSEKYNSYLIAGVRGNYWDYNGQTLVSPRAQLTFEPNYSHNRAVIDSGTSHYKNLRQVIRYKISVGEYDQPPSFREMINLSGQINPEIRAQRSQNYVAGAETSIKIFNRPFKFTTEAYYKNLLDVVPYEVNDVNIQYFGQNEGVGYSAGVEAQLNGEIVKHIPSWVSIAIMKTDWKLNPDSAYIPRPTDQRVRFSMFFQDYLRTDSSYRVHLNVVYATGLPFSPPGYDVYNYGRMPDYRRVDIGFSKVFYEAGKTKTNKKFFKKFKEIWVSAEIFNAFGFNNVISYLWLQDVQGNQWAIPNYLTNRRLDLKLEVRF